MNRKQCSVFPSKSQDFNRKIKGSTCPNRILLILPLYNEAYLDPIVNLCSRRYQQAMDYVKSYLLNKFSGKTIWKDSKDSKDSHSYISSKESLGNNNVEDSLSLMGVYYDSYSTFRPGGSPLASRHHIGSTARRRRTLAELERDTRKPILMKASVRGCVWKPVPVCQEIQDLSSNEGNASSDEEDTSTASAEMLPQKPSTRRCFGCNSVPYRK